MRTLNILTLVLLIVGGINWGLIGLFDFNLVAAIFGAGTVITRLVYIIVGACALYQLIPLMRSLDNSSTTTTTVR